MRANANFVGRIIIHNLKNYTNIFYLPHVYTGKTVRKSYIIAECLGPDPNNERYSVVQANTKNV